MTDCLRNTGAVRRVSVTSKQASYKMVTYLTCGYPSSSPPPPSPVNVYESIFKPKEKAAVPLPQHPPLSWPTRLKKRHVFIF